MTREEAIEEINKVFEPAFANYIITALTEGVTVSDKALEQEPCEDCISRQAVDELSKELVHTTRDKADFLCNFWEGLQKLPPVTPKEKTAAWVPVDAEPHEIYECNACGWLLYYEDTTDYKYCPNCGARMVSE